jgi:hypothetical protein
MPVEILVFSGVDELDALGPLEVLRTAQGSGAEIETKLVATKERAEIAGAHGLRFPLDSDIVCAGGVTSGLDLAFYLASAELAQRTARAIEYERREPVRKRAEQVA